MLGMRLSAACSRCFWRAIELSCGLLQLYLLAGTSTASCLSSLALSGLCIDASSISSFAGPLGPNLWVGEWRRLPRGSAPRATTRSWPTQYSAARSNCFPKNPSPNTLCGSAAPERRAALRRRLHLRLHPQSSTSISMPCRTASQRLPYPGETSFESE